MSDLLFECCIFWNPQILTDHIMKDPKQTSSFLSQYWMHKMTDKRGKQCCVKRELHVIAKTTVMRNQQRKGWVLAIRQPEKFTDFRFEAIDRRSLIYIHSGIFVHFHWIFISEPKQFSLFSSRTSYLPLFLVSLLLSFSKSGILFLKNK